MTRRQCPVADLVACSFGLDVVLPRIAKRLDLARRRFAAGLAEQHIVIAQNLQIIVVEKCVLHGLLF